jgi:hypothetical protein
VLRAWLTSVMLVRASATFLSLVSRDVQRLHCAFERWTTSFASCALHGWARVTRHSGCRKAEERLDLVSVPWLMAADTAEESSNISLVDIEKNDVYLTEHLADHISATRHHLTGKPDHPEPPYAPSFHPPTGYWTPTEKALFFRALSVHSRLRPDLIAASIGTKSTVDVAIYLSLLRHGATRVNNDNNKYTRSRHGPATITIGRDQRPAAHQVSAELVTFEDQQAAHICAAEPMHAMEVESEARAETLRSVKNGMRVRRGEGRKGGERDREGQLARKEEFERLRAEREIEWAREDTLARLDVVALQVLDRMSRVDEERRVKAGSDDDEGGKSSTMPHLVASSSSPAGELHPTIPPPPSPPATPTPNDSGDDAGAVPSTNLSPASRRLISKRLYMRRKRAEASGRTAQLDPARLKPGRKESATSKYRQPRPHAGDDDGDPRIRIRTDRSAVVRGRTRSSASLSGSGSVLTICARMAWGCSTLVRWDTSCGVFRQFCVVQVSY